MFPKPVPATRLAEMRAAEKEREEQTRIESHAPSYGISKAMKRQNQERWLELFGKCLSPKLACKQAGISMATYNKWRTNDVWFAEQLNQVMEDWRSELLSSAVTRAIGYVQRDEDTGKVVTDADGKVVYHGASDSLTRALLNMDQADATGAGANVNVTINLKAFGLEEQSMVDAEWREVDAGASPGDP
ncbi:hypothetical protein [Chromatocurvus halotolerans]|uniref:Terminase small subunit n=1 Tax=Chromatocurvus halotolerans TaxID=1132028 RepID=A0A4R2KS70_9GAMM|nr:hypothetical protein [Chromatocurvus halotolerans]TCO77151.1 hypothetical protein EV688_103165 [Chromatocurvus halotolerans]